jgi:hypothetical protein
MWKTQWVSPWQNVLLPVARGWSWKKGFNWSRSPWLMRICKKVTSQKRCKSQLPLSITIGNPNLIYVNITVFHCFSQFNRILNWDRIQLLSSSHRIGIWLLGSYTAFSTIQSWNENKVTQDMVMQQLRNDCIAITNTYSTNSHAQIVIIEPTTKMILQQLSSHIINLIDH